MVEDKDTGWWGCFLLSKFRFLKPQEVGMSFFAIHAHSRLLEPLRRIKYWKVKNKKGKQKISSVGRGRRMVDSRNSNRGGARSVDFVFSDTEPSPEPVIPEP